MAEQKARILIVEDDIIVARDLEESLKGFGYRVVDIVSSGEDAVAKAEKERPDLVLMDIRLKGAMDGIEAADKIKAFDVPVVYVTAHSDEETLERAKQTEPFGYITKPFEDRNLHTVVEMGLYKASMERRMRSLKEFNENIVESMPLALTVVDKNGRITAINRLQEEIFETGRSGALGKALFRDYADDLKELGGPLLEKTLKTGQTLQEKGVEYAGPSGRDYVLDLFLSPLMDKGRAAGAIIAFADATEKRRLKEKVRVLEKKEIHQLTENDKMILYGLVRYPELNSIKLAKKLKMKRTTVIGIINKLRRRGLYSTYRIPDLASLGYSMMIIEAGAYEAASEKEVKDACKNTMASPRYVYCTFTDREYFSISVAKDSADYRRNVVPSSIASAMGAAGENHIRIEFPIESADPARFFDYGSVLGNLFGIADGTATDTKRKRSASPRDLSKNELKVLHALVKYPDMTESEISEKTSLSKVTVNQIKRRLTKEGLAKTVRVPDLKKLGYGMLLFISANFRPSAGGGTDILKKLPAQAIRMEDALSVFAMMPYRDFSEYRASYDAYASDPVLQDALVRPPESIIFPLNTVRGCKFDYSGLF